MYKGLEKPKFLCPAWNVAEYCIIPSEIVSVRPSVHPSISTSCFYVRPINLAPLEIFLWNLVKYRTLSDDLQRTRTFFAELCTTEISSMEICVVLITLKPTVIFIKLHKSNASPRRCAENKNRDYICIFTESCPFVIFSIEIVSAL